MTRHFKRGTKWSRQRSNSLPPEFNFDIDATVSLLDLIEVLELEVRSTVSFIYPDAGEPERD